MPKRILTDVALLGTVLLGCFSTTSVASAAKVVGGFAVVQFDGEVAAQKGVKKVKTISTGVYLVKFRRPVEGWAFAVQTGIPTPGGGGALVFSPAIVGKPEAQNYEGENSRYRSNVERLSDFVKDISLVDEEDKISIESDTKSKGTGIISCPWMDGIAGIYEDSGLIGFNDHIIKDESSNPKGDIHQCRFLFGNGRPVKLNLNTLISGTDGKEGQRRSVVDDWVFVRLESPAVGAIPLLVENFRGEYSGSKNQSIEIIDNYGAKKCFLRLVVSYQNSRTNRMAGHTCDTFEGQSGSPLGRMTSNGFRVFGMHKGSKGSFTEHKPFDPRSSAGVGITFEGRVFQAIQKLKIPLPTPKPG